MNCVMPRTRAGQPVLKVQLPTEVDLVIPAHQSFTAGYASEFSQFDRTASGHSVFIIFVIDLPKVLQI